MKPLFVNNGAYSQTISGDGSNQAEISSEVVRGGIAAPVAHRVEQHTEPRHEEIHTDIAEQELVPAPDARANLLSKLAAELSNLQQELTTNPSTLTDEQPAALVKELQ